MGYIVKEGFRGVRRNLSMVIALVLTTAISFALVSTGILTSKVIQDTKDMFLDDVQVMVMLEDEDAASEIEQILEDTGGVESIEFFTEQESYENFVELFAGSEPELVEEVSEDAFAPTLHVKLEDPTDTTPLEAVSDHDDVSQVVNQNDDVTSVVAGLDSIRNAAAALAIALSVAAILLIGNMVVLSASYRREEMALMRTIGASRSMVNGPFIVEAVLAALIGGVVGTAATMTGALVVLQPAINEVYSSQLIAPVSTSDIAVVSVLVSVVGTILAGVTAALTLKIQEKRGTV